MKAKDIKKLNWVPVTDWKDLTQTYINLYNGKYVRKEDIECFIENICRDIARKLNISYIDIFPILKEENSAFYGTMKRLFIHNSFYSIADNSLMELEQLLRVPDVESIKDNSVEKILNDFSLLKDTEKLEVLKRLKLVSVKVEFNN